MAKIDYEIVNTALGMVMDKTRDKIILADKEYKEESIKEEHRRQKYLDLDLSDKERKIIEKYVAQIENRCGRTADLSYMAGVKNAIELMNGLGLLKKKKLKGISKKCNLSKSI